MLYNREMDIFVLIAVLVVLIVAHELGHLIAAKLSKMRVDEFGIGYPPRALTLGTLGETRYTLNWLPFGGFVKIFGEDPGTSSGDPRAFSSRPRILQTFVLVAGVTMNLLLAYVLVVSALLVGTPRALAPEDLSRAHDLSLGVASVMPNSPAAEADIVPGDVILAAEDGHYAYSGTDAASFTSFVAQDGGNKTVTLSVRRANGVETVFVRPAAGIVPNDPERHVLGVSVATIGVIDYTFPQAITEGFTLTYLLLKMVATGLWSFFGGVFTLQPNLSDVAGPVGLAGVVGDASASGLGDLLSLMAVISINLALINLIPVPALDGGRLLFVLIESIIRRPINTQVVRVLHGASFALLLLLMVVVTVSDVLKLV